MFLCGVWCGSSSQLVGSSDPGGIFRHLPHQHHQSNSGRSNINLFFSALSLLAIHQLQGCSNSLVAMPEQFSMCPHSLSRCGSVFLVPRFGNHSTIQSVAPWTRNRMTQFWMRPTLQIMLLSIHATAMVKAAVEILTITLHFRQKG